jgi:SSS family transporter
MPLAKRASIGFIVSWAFPVLYRSIRRIEMLPKSLIGLRRVFGPLTSGRALALVVCLVGCGQPENESFDDLVRWTALPPIPDALGFAGPIVGVHDGALIVAGGANFPDGVPWHPAADGGKSRKTYHDRVFVLPASEERGVESRWIQASTRLASPVGYGVCVSTPGGIVSIGGERQDHVRDDATKTYTSTKTISAAVVVLRWDKVKREVRISDRVVFPGESEGEVRALPPLPEARTNAAGTLVGDHIYVLAGEDPNGASDKAWRLDLSKRLATETSPWAWEQLPAWPGPARTHALAVAQSDGRETCVFLFSGRSKDEAGYHVYSDAYKLRPDSKRWTRLGDIRVDGDAVARCVMAGSAIAEGSGHVLVIGGAAGDVLMRRESEIPREIAAAKDAGDAKRVARLSAESDRLYDRHSGFGRDVLSYSAVTDAWSKVGEFPSGDRAPTGPNVGPDDLTATGSQVTTTAVRWRGGMVVASGEIAPGVRTRKVWTGKIDLGDVSFGTANWAVLSLYLVAIVWMGFRFASRSSTTDDYFTASGRIPWWAAGLSIFGTMLSAITYLSIPARAFGTDWSWFLVNMGIVATAPIVLFAFLPFFRKLKVTSAYEYLGVRFDGSVRCFGSASFICFQIGRMGVVVLLPALALSAVTGIDILFCIVVMGVLSTLYTVLGGIEAVIWTDVLQVVVLVGGALAAVVIIVVQVDGGFGGIIDTAWNANKLDLMTDFERHDLSWAKDGILVILLGAVFNSILPYISDQAVIQRYMSVADESQARRAIWTNAILTIPASVLFFFVGTALWVFYRSSPEALVPIEKADQLFPWFIAQEMPAGLAGLVIAGVFAATMSSLDSSMHSISTVLTTDFYRRFRPHASELQRLRFARAAIVVLGVVGTFSALLMAQLDIKYLWDAFMSIMGLFLGTLGGLFTLGIFTRRPTALHAWIGVFASAGVLYVTKFHTDLHFLLNGVLSLGTCVVVGVIMSRVIPVSGHDVRGLTIYDLRDKHR